MALPIRLIEERTDLDHDDVALLAQVTAGWSLVADLGLSDLVMWVPTWNESGVIAVAQVRPTTAPTAVPEDLVGQFWPRTRAGQVSQSVATGLPVRARHSASPLTPVDLEVYPIARSGRVIAVVARNTSSAPRVAGRLEEVYLDTADALLAMLVEGSFPGEWEPNSGDVPRVGDGLVRLDSQGHVVYASPNAISALRRLGLATEFTGASLGDLAVRLSHRPGPVDEALSAIARGRAQGSADIENASAAVRLTGIPLLREGIREGAVVLLQDITDLRRRERALLTKDATIREIHHRVKNNLQTVAAMLRLQARRSGSDEARNALAEAELRVAAIAVVHESLSTGGGQLVEFDEVADRIVRLVRDLAPGYTPAGEPPVVRREGTWGLLAADQAIPLAMTLSELAHNAVEHARASEVVIHLGQEDDGRTLIMVVADDGIGMEPDAPRGLGLGIVETLTTSSLNGSFVVQPGEGSGVRAVVTVPRAVQ